MMNKAKGPVWHSKQKAENIVPKGLRGLDKEGTWCKSNSDGWVYGHGSFSFCSHDIPVLGRFMYIRNSQHEAKTMWFESYHHKDLIDYMVMDSKADDYPLFRELQRQRDIQLVTRCRSGMDKTPERKYLTELMKQPEQEEQFRERGFKVEPMQGLVKDIFELDVCWMRGEKNNRWLFAAMGIAVQISQLAAYRNNRSTWEVKDDVLGV